MNKWWFAKSKDERRDYNLRYMYGISLSQWNAIFVAQDGRCGICGKPQGKQIMKVDHNHTTKRVRGLLCTGCNAHLWALEHENSEWRLRAERYLEKHDWSANVPVQDSGNF